MAIDYHICSLDGNECNTEDCNDCEKAQSEKKRRQQEDIIERKNKYGF